MRKSALRAIAASLVALYAFAALQPAAAGQNDNGGVAPRIAVYVAGKRNMNEKRLLTTAVLDALIKSGKFEAIERSEMFLAQIENELEKQHSGAVYDSQISVLGKQSGVEFVCVVDANYIRGAYMVSARVIDVETAQVTAMGVTESRLTTTDEYNMAASELAAKMFGPRQSAAAAPSGDVEVVIVGPGDIYSTGIITVSIDGDPYGSMRGDGTLKITVPSGTRLMTVKWQGKDTANETKKPFKFTAKKGKRSMFKVKMKMFGPIKVTAMK
jgi:hypothetical protein